MWLCILLLLSSWVANSCNMFMSCKVVFKEEVMEHSKEELDKFVDQLMVKDAVYIARRLSQTISLMPSMLCQWSMCHGCPHKSTCIHMCHLEEE